MVDGSCFGVKTVETPGRCRFDADSRAPTRYHLHPEPSSMILYLAVVTPLKLVRCPLARSYPRHFTLITRTPRACASYPSCVAVYPRDSRSRRVLCR